jgi:putative DNA primase/helicase
MTKMANKTQESGADPDRPRALEVIAERIPAGMQALPRCVVWKYKKDVDAETGAIEYDKPPLNARTGKLASSTNPDTWATFAGALAVYRRGGLDGIGFVLHREKGEADGLVGIDLDHCRDPETGTIEPWALEVVRTIDSYTEISPSGCGLRIFLYGNLPPHGRKKGKYENYQTGRYVTVTGHHVEGTPRTIEARQAELEAVHRKFWPEKPEPAANGTVGGTPTNLDDAEIVRRASEARNGAKFTRLWSGDISGHNSHSDADLALCNYLAFWCGPDQARIAELFAQSGLYRSKWNREDYRARTIGKALAGRTEFYTPKRGGGVYFGNGDGNGNRNGDGNGDGHNEFGDRAPDNPPAEKHLTDRGNAQRVVERHGHELRYCHPWKSFLAWDGKRWRLDDTAEAVRRVKETQAALYAWAAEQLKELGEADEEDQEKKSQAGKLLKLLKHCLAWESQKAIEYCLKSITSEQGIPILPAELDADPFLLNVHNGTIDLRTGKLREHRQPDFLTKLAGTEYHENAACPLWMSCLRFWMNDNDDLIGYLRRVIGYLLTGSVDEQCLWLFHGSGANGKSTLLLILLALLGDYAWQSVADLLMMKKNETHPTERADLFGKRLVATIETEEGQRVAEALMKQLTGGDKVTARRMRQDFFSFTPTHKIIMAANHKPRIQGRDYAVWRRIKLVPFEATIGEEAKDKRLVQKLKGELPGILAWAVRGCLEWQKAGLGEPDEVRQATTAYQAEQDLLAAFIAEVCFVHRDAKAQASVFFAKYQEWSGDHRTTQKTFTELMEGKGYRSEASDPGLRKV